MRAARADRPGAVERNCAACAASSTGGAQLCAVVKADGYGHGAVDCAAGGARGRRRLARGRHRARGGAAARRLPQPPPADDGRADRRRGGRGPRGGLGARGLDARRSGLARGAGPRARGRPRGSTSSTTAAWAGSEPRTPAWCCGLARGLRRDPDLELAGVWTHFATADEPGSELLRGAARALRRARRARPRASTRGASLHAANSAATLRDPALALRHGPLRDRGLRAGPVRRGPGRAAARAGALAALLRRRREALRAG